MKTISNDVMKETVINKSRFIAHLYKVNNIDEVREKLDYINNKYSDATHNCYAYSVSSYKKASDDGEPSGTAGLPILNVIESNDLTNVLFIVTRYFGGIKLGAGGLVRAYTNSITNALNEVNIKALERKIIFEITFKYDDVKTIDFILKDEEIIEKDFDLNIKYKVISNYESYNEIKNKLINSVITLNEIKEILA